MNRPKNVIPMLNDPTTRQEALYTIAEWVKWTCMLFGASTETGYKIAAAFIKGLESAWEKGEEKNE